MNLTLTSGDNQKIEINSKRTTHLLKGLVHDNNSKMIFSLDIKNEKNSWLLLKKEQKEIPNLKI